MELGNTADLISAGCNIVMAGAAIGAYLIAKDYFTDMVKRDGYEITKKIQLELLPQLGETFNLSEINLLDHEVPRYINGQNSILDDDDEISTLDIMLKRQLDSLIAKRKKYIRVSTELQDLKQSLGIYGWKMKENKEHELNELLRVSEILFIHIHNIILYLSEILSREAPDFLSKNTNKLLDGFDKMSSNSPIAIRDINSLTESLVKVQNKLYRTGEDTIYDKTLDQFGKYLSGGRHLKNFFEYKPK